MRGKDILAAQPVFAERITPAYAGKRPSGGHHRAAGGDHPRVCGEKKALIDDLDYDKGSPPRMRGKVLDGRNNGADRGITPAYAGKRSHATVTGTDASDHPRVCGEKTVAFLGLHRLMGSPPRMRGKALSVSTWTRSPGITPAYAGKRLPEGWEEDSDGDHPRVCGEKRHIQHHDVSAFGSPPRMRGKASRSCRSRAKSGITPAYAGKRGQRVTQYCRYWDHPRVCGEKLVNNLLLLS